MNNKGFTLVEMLATIVVLSIIVGITVGSVVMVMNSAKENSEEVFVETIHDAMDLYLSGNDSKKLDYVKCPNFLYKNNNREVSVYKTNITFNDVINSEYKPLVESDLVNPKDKNLDCANSSDIDVEIYRDEDYVYYYKINKSEFGCLTQVSGKYSDVITNLPVIDGSYYECGL